MLNKGGKNTERMFSGTRKTLRENKSRWPMNNQHRNMTFANLCENNRN